MEIKGLQADTIEETPLNQNNTIEETPIDMENAAKGKKVYFYNGVFSGQKDEKERFTNYINKYGNYKELGPISINLENLIGNPEKALFGEECSKARLQHMDDRNDNLDRLLKLIMKLDFGLTDTSKIDDRKNWIESRFYNLSNKATSFRVFSFWCVDEDSLIVFLIDPYHLVCSSSRKKYKNTSYEKLKNETHSIEEQWDINDLDTIHKADLIKKDHKFNV